LDPAPCWVREKSLCVWDESRASCSIREPRGVFLKLLIIALVVLASSIVPQIIVTMTIERVFTTTINMHDEDRMVRLTDTMLNGMNFNSSPSNQKELSNISTRFDASMTSEEFRQDKKIRKDCQLIVSDVSHHHDCDEHLKNRALVQYFILEQLDSLAYHLLSKHFFFTDSARPHRANRILWFIVFITLLTLWIYFSYFIYYWTIFASVQESFCWGFVFLISWFIKVVLLEYVSIYFLYVLPVDWFQSQLFDIFVVLERAHTAENVFPECQQNVSQIADVQTPNLSETSMGPVMSAAYRASQRLSRSIPLRASVALSRIDAEVLESLRRKSKEKNSDGPIIDRSKMPPLPRKPAIPKELSQVLPDSQRGHRSHMTLEEDELYMLPRASVRVEHTFAM